ncbi:MAP7 domain-containing protein 2 [Salarias fasciatus]|uniref:MAP7 domain-containing protein 2 n=1 Tax=Salarias fasciatus TaxID=181472 RepID=UPI00117678A9|nr:MAP7 domain-containing protein 2-like [Salarias fasciatus]
MTDTLAPPPVPPLTNRPPGSSRSLSNHRSRADVTELQQKECRVQQQLQRQSEERGRRMEEQRKKETQRQAAAGERRRQQQEAEKERLEALVRRRAGTGERRGGAGGEARDHLDNRPKRWTWGGPPDGAEGNPLTPPRHAIGSSQPNEPPASSASQSCNVVDFLVPPTMDQPMNKQLSNSSAALHSTDRASSRNNRSSSNRRSVAGLPEEGSRARSATLESPNTPVRSSSFRANSKGPATPKRVRSNKNRVQSPCSPGQFPSSPVRHRATTPGTEEVKGHSTLERKSTKSESSEKKIPKSSSRELTAESPCTPTGRGLAGTTDAEEASRLLAERRRLARIQKEQEEKQRQEDERLRAEEEQRRREEAARQQEAAARQAEEERVRRDEDRRSREDEERRMKEQRWKSMQDQLDREREEAFLRAQKEAERKRQEREQLHLQEEQERQQRKKRIEEIMKRTRKSDVEPPTAASGSDLGAPPSEEDSSILLGPLETKSCVDELSDGVQSMDVSPVSRDEQPSAHEFSPVTEGMDGCPLDQLMDVDAPGRGLTPAYPRLQAGNAVGDLNKNLLIHGYNAAEPAQLIHSVGPSKIDLQ